VNRTDSSNGDQDDSPKERLCQRPEAELKYVNGVLVMKSQGELFFTEDSTFDDWMDRLAELRRIENSVDAQADFRVGG
jgi:hypothetical protein